jgi:acyl-coenzyme A thioesterase PaaI-like protein
LITDRNVCLEDPQVLRRESHPHCLVCGDGDLLGLRPSFSIRRDGSVECRFLCKPDLEGYPSQLHGGVIGLYLDAAMTNCLFAHGHVAVTAELHVRYRHPVETRREAMVRAWIRSDRPPLRLVDAELIQDGRVKATASAKFIDRA